MKVALTVVACRCSDRFSGECFPSGRSHSSPSQNTKGWACSKWPHVPLRCWVKRENIKHTQVRVRKHIGDAATFRLKISTCCEGRWIILHLRRKRHTGRTSPPLYVGSVRGGLASYSHITLCSRARRTAKYSLRKHACQRQVLSPNYNTTTSSRILPG